VSSTIVFCWDIGHFKYSTNCCVSFEDHIMWKWWNTKAMIMLEHIFVPIIIFHPVFEANHTKVSEVQLESWHVVVAKFHDLPTRPAIDQANVIYGLWLCIMKNKCFSWRGHWHINTNLIRCCWIIVFNDWCWAKLLLMVLHWSMSILTHAYLKFWHPWVGQRRHEG